MRLVVGIPGPNARQERVGPTEKDWIVGEDSVSGWASAPAPEDPSGWTYFWLEGSIASARYRCYPESQRPAPWKPLRSAAEVFAITGHEEDDEEADEPAAELGGAERLLPGIYCLDFLCRHEGEEVCLDGIRFDVPSGAKGPLPGTVLALDLERPQKRWWKFW